MTKPATILGTQVLLKVGDGASPEVFTQPCLINLDRDITFTAAGNKIEVPDCASPDDPAWMEFVKQTLDCALTGTGVLDTASVAAYMTWLASPNSKNVQIWLATLGHFDGAFHLTTFGIKGSRGQKATANVGMDSDGEVVWTAA